MSTTCNGLCFYVYDILMKRYSFIILPPTGADPLLQLLYETNNTAEVIEDGNLCENPSVWQFRDRISVTHLMQMFTRSRQNCPVMKQFLEEVNLI